MWSEKRKREYTTTPLLDRILSKVVVRGDCWIWGGSTNNKGYGMVSVGSRVNNTKRPMLAHRASFIAHGNQLSDDDKLLHACDTPACVNPSHLRVGTQKENMADCVAKGRISRKLSDSAISEIRSSALPSRLLAKKYSVSKNSVLYVKSGRCWGAYP